VASYLEWLTRHRVPRFLAVFCTFRADFCKARLCANVDLAGPGGNALSRKPFAVLAVVGTGVRLWRVGWLRPLQKGQAPPRHGRIVSASRPVFLKGAAVRIEVSLPGKEHTGASRP
jgi:hypothetical protein